MMSVESIASFRELTRGSLASKPQHSMAVPNQTRQPSETHAGSVIFNTLGVGISPVNCLIEHMFTILLFMRAERGKENGICPIVSRRKHASVLLRIVSFRHSCAAYQPPKQGFSHISKYNITKHGKLLGCHLQLLILVNPLQCGWY